MDLHVTHRTWDYGCGTVIAEVAAPEPLGRLLVVGHGTSWARWAERERGLQALAVVRRIDELLAGGPAHVVLGGDFNAEPEATSLRFLTGRALALHGPVGGVQPSDHYAVDADLVLPRRPEADSSRESGRPSRR